MPALSSSLQYGIPLTSKPHFRRCMPRQANAVHVRQQSIIDAEDLQQRPNSKQENATLFTHVLCPYAQRAWLVLLEKSVPFDLINVDLSSKPRWYSDVNPAGLVPAVEWQGNVQTESLDICRWVDSNFEGPPLIPQNSENQVEKLIRNSSRFVSAGISLLSGANGRSWGIGSGQSQQQKEQFNKELQRLAEAITLSGGPFLCGDSISLADIVYYPFAERFDLIAPKYCGVDLRKNSTINNWLNSLNEREAVQMCSPDAELFLQAIKKHLSLDFFDFHTYRARDLHPHL